MILSLNNYGLKVHRFDQIRSVAVKKIINLVMALAIPLLFSGCFVGETAALVVQAPFEVADVVIPGDVVSSVGEGAGWVTDAVIPF